MRALLLLAIVACAPRVGAPAVADRAPAAAFEEEPVDIGKMWNFQDPAGSEQRFLAAAAEADGELRLELLTQAARAQTLQRRFDEAHATLDEVEPRLTEATPTARMRLLLERGRVHRSSGDAAASRPFFERAWEHGRAHGLDTLSVDAAHMVAIVAGGDEAFVWNGRALELAQRSDEPGASGWLGALANNMGWDHFDAGRYEEALELWQQGAAWHAERQTGRGERVARWTVARGLRALGRLDEALAMQRQLLSDLDALGEADGYVHEELGELLLALGRPSEAAPQFRRAHELLSQQAWLVEKEPARLARMLELAAP